MSEVRIEFGRRIDCAKNGCTEPHADNGQVTPARPGYGDTMNGHALTWVKRTVQVGDWQDIDGSPWKPTADHTEDT